MEFALKEMPEKDKHYFWRILSVQIRSVSICQGKEQVKVVEYQKIILIVFKHS